jgi:hypothetical protein
LKLLSLNKSKEGDVATKGLQDLIDGPLMPFDKIPYDMWEAIKSRDVAEQARNAAQAQIDHAMDASQYLGVQAQNFPPNISPVGQYPTNMGVGTPPSTTNSVNLASRAREMFLKRMGSIRAELRVADGDFLQCHIYGEVVHLFYCFGGRAGVTQESIDLFPSDTLITQFRMVLST